MQLPASVQRSAFVLVLLSLLATALGISTPSAQAQSVNVKVNFQPENVFQNPASDPIPDYLRDFGEAYGQRNGYKQGGGSQFYGWVVPGTQNALSLVGNARNRSAGAGAVDARYRTLLHMQADDVAITPGVLQEGAWEIQVPSGKYEVTVAVGDPQEGCNASTQDRHTIYLESTLVISNFVSTGGTAAPTCNKTQAAVVQVNDGRLTVAASGPQGNGFNTKINFIEILSTTSDRVRPKVASVTPSPGATDVRRDSGVLATVIVPNGGINGATLNADSVKLINTSNNQPVPFISNTSAGGDVISLSPIGYLAPNTTYRFEVLEGLRDAAGESFRPFSSTFTTGIEGGPSEGNSTIAFRQQKNIAQLPSGTILSSLSIGPDGKLYAASLQGEIYRFTINADGTLANRETINTIRSNEITPENTTGQRAVIGLAWDPAATADNLILWVTHNGPYVPQDAPDWTGKIARLSGPSLASFQNLVVNLPHSYKDHMNNSLAFGPNGKLYMPMASNTGMGAADLAWGLRPERLLNAAILEIDTQALIARGSPLDVKTEEGGSYNPYAAGAPVKIYATGVRNGYDLVFHSNGQLYTAGNGSAAGANMPDQPAGVTGRPECQNRIDGKPYSYPDGVAISGPKAAPDQNDYLFRIEQGGYYGHPNPLRCEYIAYGGNPTDGIDPQEQAQAPSRPGYPVGVQPDPNYRGIAYDFDVHISPNGMLEYKSETFSGTLKGRLLVVRHSQRDDVIVLEPGGAGDGFKIVKDLRGLPGLGGLNNPLDLAENTANGDVYVIEFGPPSQITLLRPLASSEPQIEATPTSLLKSDAAGGAPAEPRTVTIKNTGSGTLGISGITLAGADAGEFSLVPPSLPIVLEPGNTTSVQVRFAPTNANPSLKEAKLQVSSNANNAPTLEVNLLGLAAPEGGEPSLQAILELYDYDVNIGDDDPNTAVIHSDPATQKAAMLGNEIDVQRFVRADNANPVIVEPLAVYGPTANNPVAGFGWYRTDATLTPTELFSISNTPASNGQTVNPVLSTGNGPTLFDPGSDPFGFFATTGNGQRTVFSQDALNSFEQAVPHHMRVYRLRDANGSPVENAFVVAIEFQTSDLAYQDLVVVVRNARPADPIVVDPDRLEWFLPFVGR